MWEDLLFSEANAEMNLAFSDKSNNTSNASMALEGSGCKAGLHGRSDGHLSIKPWTLASAC